MPALICRKALVTVLRYGEDLALRATRTYLPAFIFKWNLSRLGVFPWQMYPFFLM